MSANFVDDLIESTRRVFSPDIPTLKEVLIISGVPEKTQNLRFLSFNRQVIQEDNMVKAFSATALINNRMAGQWMLEGYVKKVSQVLFNPLWTRSELELFIVALRCSPDVIAILTSCPAAYSLLGILEIEDRSDKGIFKRWSRRIRPALVIPGLSRTDEETVATFERANEIRRSAKKNQRL